MRIYELKWIQRRMRIKDSMKQISFKNLPKKERISEQTDRRLMQIRQEKKSRKKMPCVDMAATWLPRLVSWCRGIHVAASSAR